MALTKEELKAAPTLKIHKVSVPELGGCGHTYLRKLSIGAQEAWECLAAEVEEIGTLATIKKHGGFRTYLLGLTMCDKEGALLFDSPEEAIEILRELDQAPMVRLFDEAIAFVKVSTEGLDELEGNSDAAPSEDSP